MQYTKPMIDQVFQIRKAAPDHLRAQIKLANPNLLDVLADAYRELHDGILRDLIQQLMSMAGPSGLSLLENPAAESRSNHNQQFYRGQPRTAEPNTTNAPSKSTPPSNTPGKNIIYRGRIVQP